MSESSLSGTNATIRAELARRRISHSDLAAAVGLSSPSLSRRLTGKYSWSLDELLKIAAFLDVEPAALLPGAAPASNSH